jgi:hypothetical protein
MKYWCLTFAILLALAPETAAAGRGGGGGGGGMRAGGGGGFNFKGDTGRAPVSRPSGGANNGNRNNGSLNNGNRNNGNLNNGNRNSGNLNNGNRNGGNLNNGNGNLNNGNRNNGNLNNGNRNNGNNTINRNGNNTNINVSGNTVIRNPVYVNNTAWGWNRGVAWYPAPYYWGGGFWGAMAIGVTSAAVYGSIVSSNVTYNSYQIQSGSPGYTFLTNYQLVQVPCGPPNLVVVYGPQNSVICANPNNLVAAGSYQLNTETLSLTAMQ